MKNYISKIGMEDVSIGFNRKAWRCTKKNVVYVVQNFMVLTFNLPLLRKQRLEFNVEL